VERPYPIFIYGGSTAMGMEAIQFAKLSGATVIATASPANKELLLSLGADHVVDYNSPSLVDEVRCLSKEPVQFAFDASPSEDSAKLVAQVLSRDGKGRYVCLIPGIEEVVKAVNPTVMASSILAYSVLGEPYWFDKKLFEGVPADLELQKSFARVAEKLLGEGKLRAPRVFLNRGGDGLEGVLHGLEEMRAKKVRGGKLVYTAKHEDGNGGAA
jgi:NADPH:quinone reductase-like Zn-dependent oxidoreductase